MNYEEALKKVKADKPLDNFITITLGYGNVLLMPFTEGTAFLASLIHAERFMDEYNKAKRIEPFERDSISFRVMSRHEYQRLKIATLLNLSPEAIEALEKGEEVPS